MVYALEPLIFPSDQYAKLANPTKHAAKRKVPPVVSRLPKMQYMLSKPPC